MKKRNFISSIVLLVLALAIMMEARKLPFGTLKAPQVGFLPFILSILLAIFSLILFARAIREKGDKEGVPFEMRFGSWEALGLAVGALLAFTVFVERVGYIISSFLFVAFLMRTIQPQKWWLVIVVALLSSLGCYILFVSCLGTTLPEGIFGF